MLNYRQLEKDVSDFRKELILKNKSLLQNSMFFEFGVHGGTTIRDFRSLYSQIIPDYAYQFYGFDSFFGLPKEKN